MLLFCIELIFKLQESKIGSVKSKINSLKIFVLDLDFFKNLLLVSVTQADEAEEDFVRISQAQARAALRKGNFYRTIKHVSEEIVAVSEEHVEWAVKFLEKFFEIEPEIFTDYLEKFKSIINKSNEVRSPENFARDHPLSHGNRGHHRQRRPGEVPRDHGEDPGAAHAVVVEEEAGPLSAAEHVHQFPLQKARARPLFLLRADHRAPLGRERGALTRSRPSCPRSSTR